METQNEGGQQAGTKSGIGQQLMSSAKGAGTEAVDRLHSEVDNRKGTAVTQVQSIKSAIDRTAEGLGDDTPEWLRSALTQGAQQVQKFAETLEGKDSRQLVSDITDFARRSPVAFLAGCAVVGFAAARILSVGAAGNQPSQPEPVGLDSDFDAMSDDWADTTTPSGATATSIPATPVSGELV